MGGMSSGVALLLSLVWIIVSCYRTACFASCCQSSYSGSQISPILGIWQLPLLVPNLVLVTEVCKQLVLIHITDFLNQEAYFDDGKK